VGISAEPFGRGWLWWHGCAPRKGALTFPQARLPISPSALLAAWPETANRCHERASGSNCRAVGASQQHRPAHVLLPVLRWHGPLGRAGEGCRRAFRYQTGIRSGVSPGGRAAAGASPQLAPAIPCSEKHAITRFAIFRGGAEAERFRYQTGIRAAQTREVPIARHLSDLPFRSLRGLDLNQRPLGYERSAQAYPVLIGHVRFSEIT
jgi:hypothetical protein